MRLIAWRRPEDACRLGRCLRPSPKPDAKVAGRWPVGRPVRLVLPAEAHQALIAMAGADHVKPEGLIMAERKRRAASSPWPRPRLSLRRLPTAGVTEHGLPGLDFRYEAAPAGA